MMRVRKRTLVPAAATLLLAGVLLAAAPAPPEPAASYPNLSDDLTPLQQAFNQNAGKVRLLMFLDPVCPTCLAGAAKVRHEVLERIASQQLQVDVVWMPVLSRMPLQAFKRAVRSGVKRLPDARVRHYLDPKLRLGEGYRTLLGLPEDEIAYDVFLLFNHDTLWQEALPVPALWMHQLGAAPDELRLDAGKLAAEIEQRLAAIVARRAP